MARRHEQRDSEKGASDTEDDSAGSRLKRSMSSLDPAQEEAEARQQSEKEIKESYRQADGEEQDREQPEKFTQNVFELGLAMVNGSFTESKKCLPLGDDMKEVEIRM